METIISQTEQPAGTPLPRKPNPRQRILVVESEADIRRLNSELLVYSGYQVDAVEDGAVAWETLQQNSYDLLVTAHHLPKVSGVELIRKMHDTSMRLPVIMTTHALPTWELATRPLASTDHGGAHALHNRRVFGNSQKCVARDRQCPRRNPAPAELAGPVIGNGHAAMMPAP